MVQSGKRVRFTASEIEQFRKVGIVFTGVKTQDDIRDQIALWANTLANDRPELLEKIAREIANIKGVKMPAKLTAVRSTKLP